MSMDVWSNSLPKRFKYKFLSVCLIFGWSQTFAAGTLDVGPCDIPSGTLTLIPELQCNVEMLSAECVDWFIENPDTKAYGRHCSDPHERRTTLEQLKDTCGEAWGKAWMEMWAMLAGIWNGAAESFKQSEEFFLQCENDASLDCKRQLAVESYFKFRTDDELRDVSTLDLLRKRTQVREMAKRDPKYKQMLERANVPLPEGESSLPPMPPLSVLLGVANKKLSQLKVKFQCYNGIGYTRMACYALGSIIDPTIALGGAGLAAKGGRWAWFALTATTLQRAGEVTSKVESVGEKVASAAKAVREGGEVVAAANAAAVPGEAKVIQLTAKQQKVSALVKNSPELKSLNFSSKEIDEAVGVICK